MPTLPPLHGLSLRDLTLRHAPDVTLRFADLDVPAGATLRVHGASGSGKSTLVALIAGLLTPTTGQVRVGSVDVGALDPRARDAWRGATLGVVPQRLHLSPGLDVRRNLQLPFVCAGEPVDDERIARTLQHLGIAHLAGRRPHQLSVGQAQRVALARAVVRRPLLIVADEPTASLDDRAAADALALLKQAAADTAATLVVATHDRRAAEAFPDARVLTLDSAA